MSKSEAENYRDTVLNVVAEAYYREKKRQKDNPITEEVDRGSVESHREGYLEGLEEAARLVGELPWPGPTLGRMRTERRILGICGVDSGQILLVDPCYIEDSFSYDECCRVTNGPVCEGVGVSTGLGDGSYEVIGTFGELPHWGKRLLSAEIVFICDVELEDDGSSGESEEGLS